MKLLDPDTIWIFLSGSDEDRFLSDIAFGIQCLLHRNFPEDKIILFIDQPSGSNFISAFGFPQKIQIYPTSSFSSVIQPLKPEKLAIIVTGHGGLLGISATPDISPFSLLNEIKSISSLKVSLIVLGQCYAGTFNFLEARSIDSDGKVITPEICLIGATELASSLSVTVDLSKVPLLNSFSCPLQWTANYFLLCFMQQVAVPIDFDGDNISTVLDAYKAAGIGTNEMLLESRRNAFKDMYENLLFSTISELTKNPITQQLAATAKQDLMQVSELLLTNQSPWILHANLARKLEM